MFKMFYSLSVVLMSFSPVFAFAQDPLAETPGKAGGCVACQSLLLFAVLAFIALNVALLFWVYRDAQNRSMDYGIAWLILVFVFGPLAAIVYLFARKKGNLVRCAGCGGKRLDVIAKCPHCSNV
jgi:hypothetical protein